MESISINGSASEITLGPQRPASFPHLDDHGSISRREPDFERILARKRAPESPKHSAERGLTR